MGFRDYSSQLTQLKVAPNLGGAPHKPVLLLTIMECIENGIISTPRVYLTREFLEVFNSNWDQWVYTPHKKNPALPIYHLQHEKFWTLGTLEGKEIPVTEKNSVSSLKALTDSVAYALLEEELFHALCDPLERMRLKVVVVKRYFPDIPERRNPFVIHLKEMEQQMLSGSPAQYRRQSERAGKLQQGEERKKYAVERMARDTLFSELVKEVYNFRCCISGMRVMWEDSSCLLDACHIVPFSNSLDDTIGNGIPLCPTLHRAFDNGLIGIDASTYQVMVSKAFREDRESIYLLRQLQDLPVKLPDKATYYPLRENLQWHRENVFRE